MPKNKGKAVARKNIRVPESLVHEVDRVVRASELYLNRQQFVESAIREKVEGVGLCAGGHPGSVGLVSGPRGLHGNRDDGFLGRVREAFLVHTTVELARGEILVHDSSPGDFGEKVRAYVRRRAEIQGKRLTERQVDELTESLLDYRREIVGGLSALNRNGLRDQ